MELKCYHSSINFCPFVINSETLTNSVLQLFSESDRDMTSREWGLRVIFLFVTEFPSTCYQPIATRDTI